MKSEFLTQIDGAAGAEGPDGEKKIVMVLAATNFPWDLDEALRRRLEKRIYIPLPGAPERAELFKINLRGVDIHPEVDFEHLARQTEGYSGDDITNVVRDAAMNGMRRKIAGKTPEQIRQLSKADVSDPVTVDDFEQAVKKISPSVSKEDTLRHETWLKEFGAV